MVVIEIEKKEVLPFYTMVVEAFNGVFKCSHFVQYSKMSSTKIVLSAINVFKYKFKTRIFVKIIKPFVYLSTVSEK